MKPQKEKRKKQVILEEEEDICHMYLLSKELYHCGASIKDLGKKCFGINKIEDENIIK